jgi:hypothetical protein
LSVLNVLGRREFFDFTEIVVIVLGVNRSSWRLSWIELNPGTNTGRYREMMNNRESAALQEEKK